MYPRWALWAPRGGGGTSVQWYVAGGQARGSEDVPWWTRHSVSLLCDRCTYCPGQTLAEGHPVLGLFLVGIRDRDFIPRGHLLPRDAFDPQVQRLLLASKKPQCIRWSPARGYDSPCVTEMRPRYPDLENAGFEQCPELCSLGPKRPTLGCRSPGVSWAPAFLGKGCTVASLVSPVSLLLAKALAVLRPALGAWSVSEKELSRNVQESCPSVPLLSPSSGMFHTGSLEGRGLS